MPALLVLIIVGVPLLEIFAIVQVAQLIGGGWATLLLLVNCIVGASLLRSEGAHAWREVRAAASQGRWPGDEVVLGALALAGGVLLLAPGFVTDAVGIVLLFRPSRRSVAAALKRRMARRAPWGPFGIGAARTARGEVVDVEVIDVRRDVRRDGVDSRQGPRALDDPDRPKDDDSGGEPEPGGTTRA